MEFLLLSILGNSWEMVGRRGFFLCLWQFYSFENSWFWASVVKNNQNAFNTRELLFLPMDLISR